MAVPRYGRRRERGLLVAISHLLSELRAPTTTRGKIIVAVLAVLVFSLLSLLVVGGLFLSRVMMPLQAAETIDPTQFLQSAQTLEFETPDGVKHNGWFFPGLRGAPVVIICHGYRSSRSEILTLATSLQQHRYNVFAFNFAGHGESPVGHTTLGYRETEELKAALQVLSTRDDIDTSRIGLYGYSMGGYAVLSVAPQVPGVKAVVVDSVYPEPKALLRLELKRLGADVIPLLSTTSVLEFRLISLLYRGQEEPAEALQRMAGLPKLFITGDDAPQLAKMTQELYLEAPGPKDLVQLHHTNMPTLVENERRDYENLVVSFFLRHLPLVVTGP